MIKRNKSLLWILLIPILNVFYTFLNHGHSNTRNLITDLDIEIPFVPGFAIPYLLWYPIILVSLFIFNMKNRKVYYRTLISICIGLIVSYFLYYFFQTTVNRPTIPSDGFLNSLVRFVYLTDQPYNAFPSIHVLTSYLVIKGITDCTNLSKVLRNIIVITSWTIIISTVFVKQHVVLDVFGAIILAQFLYYIVGNCMKDQYLLKLFQYKKYVYTCLIIGYVSALSVVVLVH